MKAIVDCNSFYCSCEKVFRPDLDERPIVVLSNNDGCIISRTDEAKAIGIGMAGPYFKAKHLIEAHKVEVFSSNYNLYGDMSWRVMEVLKTFVGEGNVEVYSVDEAFLDLHGYSGTQLQRLANEIRDTVDKWTGIKVSIGMAPTKTLAKMANKMAKKNKTQSQCITILEPEEEIIAALKTTRVSDVWGIGRKYADKLNMWGITTAWDVRNLSEEWVRKNMGGVVGVRLLKELRGEDTITMKDELANKKMISTTRMFGTAVTDLCHLKEAVASYTSRAAEKLRRQNGAACMISVFLVSQEKIESPNFKHGPTVNAYTNLPQPTSLTNELIKPALQMVESLFVNGKKYKKAGVILSSIVPDDAIQGNLFEPGKSIGRSLMEMMDNINFSMRGNVVNFVSAGTKKTWKMQQSFHSPLYTTRWADLRQVE
ncbi:Y-family DNA polymerase [Chitinophagaceae bacterium LB-8]|uniref:Y-family DNA polymerase n=1 Tax=Paraflavisolibacter caeni TaxID=2982496 RepID=A0A9X3B8U8_9BACT|nr:Y-family DNA polymerase [Paraflavisolibacter caeni]MCU7551270.1 Y-family DNA polymerase [Paraflavisolibacter caeni]